MGKSSENEELEIAKQEVFRKIACILAEKTPFTLDQIKPETMLMEDADMNSLEVLLLIAELEDTFGIRLPDEELMKIVTMADLTEVITKQLK